MLRDFREYPSVLEDRSIDVINYGGTVAYRAGILSVGADIHLSQFNYESTLIGNENPTDFFGPATYATERYANLQLGDDVGLGFAGGVLVVPNRRVQFGVSYRRGATFDFEGELEYPFFPDLAGPYNGEFKVPDNFGAGVAVRPLNELTITADVNRIAYSDLTSFIQTQVVFTDDPAEKSFYSIDDAVEFHVGAEYAFTRFQTLPAVRVGFWRETEHAVSYAGTNVLNQATDLLAKDINHVAVGGGVARPDTSS